MLIDFWNGDSFLRLKGLSTIEMSGSGRGKG